jgi:hypothetical protein
MCFRILHLMSAKGQSLVYTFEPFLYSMFRPNLHSHIYQDRHTLFWLLEKSDEKLSRIGLIRSKSRPESYTLGLKLIRQKASCCLVELSIGIYY